MIKGIHPREQWSKLSWYWDWNQAHLHPASAQSITDLPLPNILSLPCWENCLSSTKNPFNNYSFTQPHEAVDCCSGFLSSFSILISRVHSFIHSFIGYFIYWESTKCQAYVAWIWWSLQSISLGNMTYACPCVIPQMIWEVSDSDWAEAEKTQTSSSKKALLLSFTQSSLSFGPTLFKFAVEDKNNPSSCKENNQRLNSEHKTQPSFSSTKRTQRVYHLCFKIDI